MLEDQDLRVLRRLEAEWSPPPARHVLAARVWAARIRWRTVLLLADLTAVLTFVIGVFAGDGWLGFTGFLALCALVVTHAWRSGLLRQDPREPPRPPDHVS